MSKHRKQKSGRTLRSVNYLATGALGVAAASAGIVMAIPPGAVDALTASPRAVELTDFSFPLAPAQD